MGRLDHVHLRVPDRDAAARWYAAHLGFEPVNRFDFWAKGFDGGPLQLSADGGKTMLALFEATDSHPMAPQTLGVAFSVDAESFAAFARELPNGILSPSGQPLRANDIVDFDLCWAYSFADPWGNVFELNCYEYERVRAELIDPDSIEPTRYWRVHYTSSTSHDREDLVIKRDNWGWRARIGLFIVSSEAVPEAEWWAMAPPGVSVHAARIDAPAPWASWRDDSEAGGRALILSEDLERGAGHFAGMRLNAVVLAHSSSSILGGQGWDDAIIARLAGLLAPDVHVTTNGLDCLAALRAAGIDRPFLVFPPWFDEAVVQAGADYVAAGGLSPAGAFRADAGRGWRDIAPRQLYPQGMGFEQDVESLYRQIRAACPRQADGVLIVGTGVRCVGIIDMLENDLGRPVVTANQASLWHCLEAIGANAAVSGYGRLLQGG